MKRFSVIVVLFVSIFVLLDSNANADWKNLVKGIMDKNTNVTSNQNNSDGITYKEKESALKQALKMGVKYAVSSLSKTDGFLDNPYVKIPIPNRLKTVAKVLKSTGQQKIVDNFVAQMNHAAEKAAPKTVDIFMKAVNGMSIQDATKILTGNDNAATEYFRKHTYSSLFKAIKPIVKESTSKTDVTKYYKSMMDIYKSHENSINTLSSYKRMLKGKNSKKDEDESLDLDTYITKKAIKGIFYMIGQEEKKIRLNPAARTTDLLKKVFGRIR